MISGLGSLGMTQAPSDGMPGTGVEYILSSPAGQAVLRPLRYPLYDATILTNSLAVCRILFANHRQFDDATSKSECDRHLSPSGVSLTLGIAE
jgi:hypothetical protein